MSSDNFRESRVNELVLPKGEFAYTRDKTSGVTFVRTGPSVVNLQGQDETVKYHLGSSKFIKVELENAAQQNVVVPTGHYAVLNNPTPDFNDFPVSGEKIHAKDLLIGQRVHIPGPLSFALWPQQHAQVIEGHQLRSNQYLLVRVYDEEAAKKNWNSAVVKRAAPVVQSSEKQESSQSERSSTKSEKSDAVESSNENFEQKPVIVSSNESVPKDLSVGRLLVIRGTDVSFYIPPTGVEVVPDNSNNYVREALTLERLQYCILIDESGEKRYVRGPDVVFPLPTERFHTNSRGDRHFRPVELNGKIQGIHVKVISAYTDTQGIHGPPNTRYKEGEELFITGEDAAIYFPCPQHSAIKYDGKTKHFATAIPAGEGRYVMQRHTGTVSKIEGGENGRVCLPDPRSEVFVRRVLTPSECEIMYPGNFEVVEYNKALMQLQLNAPATRKGVVTAGEVKRSTKMRRLSVADTEFGDSSSYGQAVAELGGDEFVRKATYSEPRTVTLGNNRYAGVPTINPWTGYAVMVTNTAGNRRVELGPKRVLLGFNETLEALSLSTGCPKSSQRLLKTAYLQVNHNKVTDAISAETADHVQINIKAAFRVNFEGSKPEEMIKWFNVSNYVKLLSDHVRSVLKAAVRSTPVEEFFQRSEDFIRDVILGKKPKNGKRSGMFFKENGMRIYDVEILNVEIGDQDIQQLLRNVQHESVRTTVQLAQAARALEASKTRAKFSREQSEIKERTAVLHAALEEQEIVRKSKLTEARMKALLEKEELELQLQKNKNTVKFEIAQSEANCQKLAFETELTALEQKQEIELNALKIETQSRVDQLKAVESGFSEALTSLGNKEALTKVAEAMSIQQFLGGKSVVDVVKKVFADSPLEGALAKINNKIGKNVPSRQASKR